ncbi:MAG: hypothetical protein PGN37_23935 [Mycobacterium kyogaense]|uniref:hypothetical protein n=1 Tax=Mycobacterium kyogaense TaxID=2212479 RepID=UPI002FF44B6F
MSPRIDRLAAFAVVLVCSGCGASTPSPQPPSTLSAPPGITTAGAVVEHLQNDRHVLLHPVDTTATDCAQAGCAQSVSTDRFTIMSFPGTGAAQRYAADHGLRQVASIVVDFSPTVPEPEREDLWADVTRSVD